MMPVRLAGKIRLALRPVAESAALATAWPQVPWCSRLVVYQVPLAPPG